MVIVSSFIMTRDRERKFSEKETEVVYLDGSSCLTRYMQTMKVILILGLFCYLDKNYFDNIF